MLRLLRGEIYRLTHKKSAYVYFLGLAVAYVLLAYVRSGGFTGSSVLDDAMTFFGLLPALAGGFLFAAVYTDDLNSRNLIALVGFGLGKTRIIIAKALLMAGSSLVIFAVVPVVHAGLYGVLGSPASPAVWTTLYAVSAKYWLMTVAFAVLSGIVVYGLQRTTFAVVAYILLAFGVVSGLLATGLKAFAPGLAGYLVGGITDKIAAGLAAGGALVGPILQLAVYLVIAGTVSAIVFNKKEMEFAL